MLRKTSGDGLTVLTLDRPARANALSAAMLDALIEAIRASAHDGTRALILTGTGRVFSAGADLDEARTGLATSPLWEQVSGLVAGLPCLTIAALNGTVAGGAMGMMLACDLRIAVPQAQFFYPVMRLGFLPQPGDVARLATLIGPARSRMILLAGQRIDAAEALAWGLIDRLAEAPGLLAGAEALAGPALAAPEGHAAAIKAMCRAATRV